MRDSRADKLDIRVNAFIKRIMEKPLLVPNVDKMQEDYEERMRQKKEGPHRTSILGIGTLGNIHTIENFDGMSAVTLEHKLLRDQSGFSLGSYQS